MVMGYLEQWESDGLARPPNWSSGWHVSARIKQSAAKAYWTAVREGIHAAFNDGADAIPDSFTPGQQGKLSK